MKMKLSIEISWRLFEGSSTVRDKYSKSPSISLLKQRWVNNCCKFTQYQCNQFKMNTSKKFGNIVVSEKSKLVVWNMWHSV